MLKTKRSGNIACGLFLAALGLAAAWASLDIDEGAGGNLHPRTFPMLIGVCLLLGGAALALISRAVAKAGADKAIDWPDRRGWKLWAIALASLGRLRGAVRSARVSHLHLLLRRGVHPVFRPLQSPGRGRLGSGGGCSSSTSFSSGCWT